MSKRENKVKENIRLNALMLLNLYGVLEEDIQAHPEALNAFVEILYEEINENL